MHFLGFLSINNSKYENFTYKLKIYTQKTGL
jgi:hypothetical protein